MAFLIVALPTFECQAGFPTYRSLAFFMTNALYLRTLIHSHLFCVDNLSDAEIREHLAGDGNPVGYEGQHILGYHWFAYPNAAEGLYSKVLARVNMFGDLVIGTGEETCLVIIRHGRLSITRQVCDDIANVHDKRLLVCM